MDLACKPQTYFEEWTGLPLRKCSLFLNLVKIMKFLNLSKSSTSLELSWNEALEDYIAGVGTDLRSQVNLRVTFMEDIYDKKTVGLDW